LEDTILKGLVMSKAVTFIAETHDNDFAEASDRTICKKTWATDWLHILF